MSHPDDYDLILDIGPMLLNLNPERRFLFMFSDGTEVSVTATKTEEAYRHPSWVRALIDRLPLLTWVDLKWVAELYELDFGNYSSKELRERIGAHVRALPLLQIDGP